MRRRLDIAASLIVTPGRALPRRADDRARPDGAAGGLADDPRAGGSSGVTILLTTQYLDEADQLAERIAVIDHGRKIAEGTSRELKAATGSGMLHVALRRSGAARARRRRCSASGSGPRCSAASRAGELRGRLRRRRRRRAEAVAALIDGGHRGRRLLDGPAEPRRGVLRADRHGAEEDESA